MAITTLNGIINITGAETGAALGAYLIANASGTYTAGVIAPNKPVYLANGGELTISGQVLIGDGQYNINPGRNYPLIYASKTTGRGKLKLVNGATLRLVNGAQNTASYSEETPALHCEGASVTAGFGVGGGCAFFGPTAPVYAKDSILTAANIDQHFALQPGSTFQNVQVVATSGAGMWMLQAGDSQGLTLVGCSLAGDFYSRDGAAPTLLASLSAASRQIVTHRSGRWYVMYGLKDLSGVRKWDVSYGGGGTQANTAAAASRTAVAWVFDPSVIDGGGAPVAGATVRVFGDAGPFAWSSADLVTGALGKVSGAFSFGPPGFVRSLSPASGVYVVKSLTPADTAGAVANQVLPSHTAYVRKYGYKPVTISGMTGDADYVAPVLCVQDAGCVLSAAAAATAASNLAITATAITVNSSMTLDALYSALQHWFALPAQMGPEPDLVSPAPEIDLRARGLTVAGGATLSAGAVYTGIRTTGVVTGEVSGVGIVDANGDSYLRYNDIDSWIVYSDPARTVQIGAGVGSVLFRFVYAPGVTYYLKCVVGSTEFAMVATPTGAGDTPVTLSTQALLTTLQVQVAAVKADTGLIKAVSL